MPEQDIQPRPEVMAFARLMEERLRANDHKSGWRGIDPMSLLQMLDTERYELSFALGLGTREDIRHEAADIANFAMMIADVAGALVVDPYTEGIDEPMPDKCPRCGEADHYRQQYETLRAAVEDVADLIRGAAEKARQLHFINRDPYDDGRSVGFGTAVTWLRKALAEHGEVDDDA